MFILPEDEGDDYASLADGLHAAPSADGSTSNLDSDASSSCQQAPPSPQHSSQSTLLTTPAGAQSGVPHDDSETNAHVRARVAEIMIMIAEPSARRKGLAAEAAATMMEWGECTIKGSRFANSDDAVRVRFCATLCYFAHQPYAATCWTGLGAVELLHHSQGAAPKNAALSSRNGLSMAPLQARFCFMTGDVAYLWAPPYGRDRRRIAVQRSHSRHPPTSQKLSPCIIPMSPPRLTLKSPQSLPTAITPWSSSNYLWLLICNFLWSSC